MDKISEVNRYLWIDQICINQGDLPERGDQVRRMREVYRKAKAVCV